MKKIQSIFSVMLLAATCMGETPALAADDYPNRPIKMVLPLPAGGITDMIARMLAQEMQASMGQPVIVENKPGGGGQIGANSVLQDEADGYTIFVGATEMFSINPTLFTRFSYIPSRDFQPVASLAGSPLVLVVPKNSKADSIEKLVEISNTADPLNYASQGVGSIGHLLAGLFADKKGAKLVHVPYKGSAPGLQDLIGAHVALMFDPVITAAPLIAGDKLKPLAIASKERSPALPEVKTLAELGVDGLDAGVWFGVVVKAGTSDEIVQRLNKEINHALKSPTISKRFAENGMEPMLMTTEQFGQFLASEEERWAALVKASGASVD